MVAHHRLAFCASHMAQIGNSLESYKMAYFLAKEPYICVKKPLKHCDRKYVYFTEIQNIILTVGIF